MQGLNLIAEIERKLQITSRLAGCFQDYRSKSKRMLHLVESLIAQRIYGLIMGYNEDLNEHEELRHDPIIALNVSKSATKRKYWYLNLLGKVNGIESSV